MEMEVIYEREKRVRRSRKFEWSVEKQTVEGRKFTYSPGVNFPRGWSQRRDDQPGSMLIQMMYVRC